MQRCKGCGKEVKYIAIKDSYVLCDTEEIEICTENGYMKKGYKIHKCEDSYGRREEEKTR